MTARIISRSTPRIKAEEAAQARKAEALRIAQERLAAHNAYALPVTEIHFTSNPGPDFMPRPWR